MRRSFTRKTGASFPAGTTGYGNVIVSTESTDLQALNSYEWVDGPDESSHWIIARDAGNSTRTRHNDISPTVGVCFWRAGAKSAGESEFLTFVNSRFPGNNFVTGASATSWLNSEGYWTNYGDASGASLIMYLDSIGLTSTVWYDQTANGNDATVESWAGPSSFSNNKVYNSFQVSQINPPGGLDYVIPTSGFGTTLDNGFTYEVWAFPLTSTNGILISEFNGVNIPTGWTDAQMAFVNGHINTGVYPIGYITGPNFTPKNWYNIVMTYDSTAQVLKEYVNGSLVGSISGAKANPGNTFLALAADDFCSGAYLGGATNFFSGNLGMWKIWNGPLDSNTILNNYLNNLYRFDQDLVLELDATQTDSYPNPSVFDYEHTWVDLSGKDNDGFSGALTGMYQAGTAQGGTFSVSRFSFPGVWPYYVSIGQPIPSGSDYSISAWVNPATVSGSRNIVSSQDSPFWVANGSLMAGVGGNYSAVSYPVVAGQWIFVSMSFSHSTNTMRLYVNGSEVNSNTNVTESYVAQDTYIGSHYYGGSNVSFWQGLISQVYIYKNVQSAGNISAVFENTRTIYGV